jgi:hypothetical protein
MDISIERALTSVNDACPVCIEPVAPDRNIAITCCGHTFCFTCVATMLSRNITLCPCCRTSMIPVARSRAPRVLPPSITANRAVVLFPPPPPPGEYSANFTMTCTLRNLCDIYKNEGAPIHPIIWSSAWPADNRPNYIDVRNFTKLLRAFDFPNDFRSTISTLHTEFKSWRRFEEVRRPSRLRTVITVNGFETMINELGFERSPMRGRTIVQGHSRGGYNVFIHGSVQCSDATAFPQRVIVDPPQILAHPLL